MGKALEQLHSETNGENLGQFNVFGYATDLKQWKATFMPTTLENASAAAAFCEDLKTEGEMGVDPCLAVEAALQVEDMEAIYFIMDGDAHVDDTFVKRVKVAYYKHPRRP